MKQLGRWLIILILALVAVLPTWPWSRRWRCEPSIIMATILAVVIYLAQAGRF